MAGLAARKKIWSVRPCVMKMRSDFSLSGSMAKATAKRKKRHLIPKQVTCADTALSFCCNFPVKHNRINCTPSRIGSGSAKLRFSPL